ncbi:MAG: tyrosine-type recombinase/integrase [Methylocella sp.]
MKEVLTDRRLKALVPAPPGERVMIWDAVVPSFGVRVTDKGSATFVIMRRLGGKLIRRSIGPAWQVPLRGPKELPVGLAVAREEARSALFDITRGVDPKEKRRAERNEKQKQQENSFGVVAEAFIAQHVKNLRSAANVSSAIRQKLIPAWGDRPISDITRSDVIKIVKKDAEAHPTASRHLLAYCKKLFGWAVAQDCYGLTASPCDRGVTASDLIGKSEPRARVLGDAELRAIWSASSRLGYPFSDFMHFLLLTGQRLREVANAEWREVDLDRGLWTIPAGRMKGKVAHEVPLAPEALALLSSLPRGTGPCVFSTTGGHRPVSGFSKAKARLDKLLDSEVENWTFHDLRRTMRTHLGGLPVPTNAAELVIAHAQPGLHKVYDRHTYREEKRRALELWAKRLSSIVETKECLAVAPYLARV